jgi:predicted metal-binding membrane protein
MTTWLGSAAHLHASGPGLGALAVMWVGMMAAMMAPTAWPWLRTFQRLTDARSGIARAASTLAFASGYLTAWIAYSVAAAIVQFELSRVGWMTSGDRLPAPLSGTLLIAAGVFQFTPWKQACLRHCRNPLTFLLARWRNGPAGGYRLGLAHGWFCVGCCWALMATALVVGMASVAWMVVLAAAVFVEQAVPHGHRLRVPIGLALIGAGCWQLIGA